jgi:hypothetical protein
MSRLFGCELSSGHFNSVVTMHEDSSDLTVRAVCITSAKIITNEPFAANFMCKQNFSIFFFLSINFNEFDRTNKKKKFENKIFKGQ